ncbi:MAG TPA: cation:proton antiporter [Alphaproteobacteria bacterium]|jgi:CPA1 family monovalent cation:H+ antiporter|nr:cation:proton antiporter [Alphaproteobacteria bacterium]
MQSTLHTVELVTIVMALLLVAAGTLALSKRIKLPFTVALVLVGIGLAQIFAHSPGWLGSYAGFSVSPEAILFVFVPTLVFESAFNLDARQLRHNLLPVLTLAIPGVLVTAGLIGGLLWLVTPLDLASALVLGAILSATDPVAVVALFRQLGAPLRLTVLVEGESLFNDATSIVLTRILVGVAVGGYFFTPLGAFLDVVTFFVVFFGGALVGWLAALGFGWLLGRVRGDVSIEITLTTVLAYLSFLVAEEVFHVSGVMAVVLAGVTLGGWGRAKISPSVVGYLEHFWEYMAFVANALIFLLVGLSVNLGALYEAIDLLAWVLLAMLLSRAVVTFGLVPLVGRLPGAERIDRGYQAVMYWGGLRGAIGLALALSLGDFVHAELFVALVMGAVLFTLLVQGLSIEWLVQPWASTSRHWRTAWPVSRAYWRPCAGPGRGCPNCAAAACFPNAWRTASTSVYKAASPATARSSRRCAAVSWAPKSSAGSSMPACSPWRSRPTTSFSARAISRSIPTASSAIPSTCRAPNCAKADACPKPPRGRCGRALCTRA